MKSERSQSRTNLGAKLIARRARIFKTSIHVTFLQLVGLRRQAQSGQWSSRCSSASTLPSFWGGRPRQLRRLTHVLIVPTRPFSTLAPLGGKRVSEAARFFPSFLSPHPRHHLLCLYLMSPAPSIHSKKTLLPTPHLHIILLDSFESSTASKARCSSHA